ncbi:MAG TPA: MASE1 domain-containing protein [Candidatus Eisenbacteria bacterium]|nr:MASE1 domain-containing protein [Candidatus Eisenbacteria bacterium]
MTQPTARIPWPLRAGSLPIVLVLLAAIYFAAAKVGLRLAAVHVSATAVWPASGIALAAVLSLGSRVWPAIFAGAFLVNVMNAGSIVTALGIASGNTLEALLGAWLVKRFANGPQPFDRAPDIFRYAGVVAVATMVSATLGVLSLVLTRFAPWGSFGPIWITWWLGDMGGALVVAPFLLLWGRDRHIPWRGARLVEAIVALASIAIVSRLVFGWIDPLEYGFALKFLCMPPLLWAAYRFDSRMGAAAVLIVAAMSVLGTLGRIAPAARGELNTWLLVLQVFNGVSAVTTLVLAAVVAERRRAEMALRSASEELRQAMGQLEALSDSISHDMRSPIATIVNYSAVIEMDHGQALGEPGIGLLNKIRASARAADNLLDQLSVFAKAGGGVGERRNVDMTALAREAFAEVATGGDVTDVLFELGDLPPAVGNPTLLLRVFRNLISNSVKYSRGRPQRRIAVGGISGDDENTYFVSDTGIGFAREERGALFQPFQRLSNARGTEGSGLGLAIVARIIQKHGGEVWAESDGVSGSRFTFTLRNGSNGS